MADNNTPAYLRYANAGATRNKPLDQNLVDALGFLQDMGVQMEVFSGGQVTAAEAAKGLGGRTGSTRHDHGGAADAFFYQGGRKLDWADPNDRPIFQEIVRRGRAAGITGFGAGPGYMQPGSMHIGLGSAGVWGAGGKGDTAPDWLTEAFSGASSGPTVARAAKLPNSNADQELAAGGFNSPTQPYVPPQQPTNPNWLTNATTPDTTFQTTPVSPPVTWGQAGTAILNSLSGTRLWTWAGLQDSQPDRKWLDDTTTTKFGNLLTDLNDDERLYMVGNAVSEGHARRLREHLDQLREDAQTMANSPMAFAGSIVANILDPVSLVAGAGIGKAVIIGSNALRASSSAGVLARMAEAGTIGVADATLATAIQSRVDPNTDAEDFAWNALTGMSLGAGIGTVARGAELDSVASEASSLFGRKAREWMADKAERSGYKFADREAFVNPNAGSVGAAKNIDTLGSKFADNRTGLEKVADKLTSYTSPEDLLMNRAGPEVKDLYQQLMPNLSGTGGREMRATEDAYTMMKRNTEVDHAAIHKAYEQKFEAWLKESGQDGVGMLKKPALEEAFKEKVYWTVIHPANAGGSNAVSEMADDLRSAFGRKLKEAKAADVAWAKDIPQDDYYMPFSVSKRAYYETTNKVGRDGLIDVIRQAFLRAQPDLYKAENAKRAGTKGKARAVDAREAKVTRLAERYLDMIERTQIDNLNAERMAGLSGDSATALRNLLAEDGVSDGAITEIMDAFGYTQKEGPANFRRRAALERDEAFIPAKFKDQPNARDYAVSLRDLTEKDAIKVYDHYARSVNGNLALAKVGFKSAGDAYKQVEEATNFRKLMDKNGGVPLAFEQDLKAAANELTYYIDRILGKPRWPGVSKKQRLMLSIMRNATFVRFMQQSGISQIGDAPKVLFRYGLAATWNGLRPRDLIDVFTHSETEANALTREIQAATGIGVRTKNAAMYALHEDINIGGELFDDDFTTRMLSKVNSGLENASRITATVSLLNPITDTLQLWAARSASQKFVDIATGRAKVSQKWLNEYGLTTGDLADIAEIAKRMELDENGNIKRWNSEKQHAVSREHADAYDRFLGLVRREAHAAILEPSPNAVWKIMSSPVGSIFMSLKSYMFASLVANTAKNIKLGPAYMGMSLIGTSIWAGMVYSSQQYANSIGLSGEERKKFLEDRLSLKTVLAAGFQRSADASILPMLIDTTIATGDKLFTGEDHRLFSNTRNSGLGSSLLSSIPALRIAEDAGSLAMGLGAAVARTDQQFDQGESKLLRDLAPLMRTYGVLNATNAIIQYMPQDTDGGLVKSSR